MRRNIVSFLAPLVLVAIVTGCSSSAPAPKKAELDTAPPFRPAEYGVKASPRVTEMRSVPKGGGRNQVGKPYKIKGKVYVPKEEPGYVATGKASWYGPNFHGRLTANGEIYDQYALSAAHPTMPLPSYARVTNLKNGTSIIVRVNDRGPYAHGRVIDVSAKTAEVLDFKKHGVVDVKVEYVGRARLEGSDDKFLLASFRGPGMRGIVPGATQPGTMLASAPQAPTIQPAIALAAMAPVVPVGNLAQEQVASFALASSGVPVPTPRPADYGYGTPFLVAVAMPSSAANAGMVLLPPVPGGTAPLSYAAETQAYGGRIADAFAAVDRDATVDSPAFPMVFDREATSRTAVVSLGTFTDPAAVGFVRRSLGDLGVISAQDGTEPGSWELTMIVGGDVADSAVAVARMRGMKDARILGEAAASSGER